jgi:hypothetical protein
MAALIAFDRNFYLADLLMGGLEGIKGNVCGGVNDQQPLGTGQRVWKVAGAILPFLPRVLGKTRSAGRPAPGSSSGPVVLNAPKAGATAAEMGQIDAYVEGCNDALKAGSLSPTGRVSTQGALRDLASQAARAERARAAAAGEPYAGQVGHVPDTTWTGTAQPYSWMDLTQRVNASLGSQAAQYPIGYQPTIFISGVPQQSASYMWWAGVGFTQSVQSTTGSGN